VLPLTVPEGTVLTIGEEFTFVDPVSGLEVTAVVLDEAPSGDEQAADSGLAVDERFLVVDPATDEVLVALVTA
jgi:hypothetical protein